MRIAPWFVLAITLSRTGHAGSEADAWLVDLHEEVAADLAAGKPLVVQVHVPLCDNDILRCGGHGLGDGDTPRTNLYWATTGGFVGWFGRRGSGWKQVHVGRADGDVLEVRVWKKRVSGRVRGFDVYVVAYAWRGKAIRSAMDAYTRDLWGGEARVIELPGGTTIRAGGEAHVVAYTGHNGWMDVSDYDFAKVASGAKASGRRKGTIAVACITEDYLAADVSAPERVPLLMTRTLLFAGAHSVEGAISEFAAGGTLESIRRAAIRAYARGQGKTEARVGSAFTNPSHRRWKQR